MLEKSNSFTGFKDKSTIKLTLFAGCPNLILLINIIADEAKSAYCLSIDSDYINRQGEHFASCFRSVQQLYDFLIAQFQNLTLTNHGEIIFEAKSSLQNQEKVQRHKIVCVQQQLAPIQQILLKIEILSNRIKGESEDKDKRIKQLERRQQISETQNDRQIQTIRLAISEQFNRRSLKEAARLDQTVQRELRIIKDELKESKEKAAVQNAELWKAIGQAQITKKKDLSQVREDAIIKIEENQGIRKPMFEHESKMQYISKIIDQFKEKNEEKGQTGWVGAIVSEEDSKKQKFLQLRMHPQNPHQSSFSVKEELNSITVTKVENNGKYHGYFGTLPLVPGRLHQFQIRLRSSREKQIFLGIGSKGLFGIQFGYSHNEAISYYFRPGAVYEFGRNRAGGSSVIPGSMVTMRVNLIQYSVDWSINEICQAIASIPPEKRIIHFLFFFLMYHTGDEVQLLF